MSYNLSYKEFYTRYYNNNSGYLDNKFSKYSSVSTIFHTSCPFTLKKKCNCKIQKVSLHENSHIDFIHKLYNGAYDIDISGKTIQIKDNTKDSINPGPNIIKDRLKKTNYHKMKEFKKHINESFLNLYDYKDVEKTINDDKKICEKCGINLYGDNYHKGWKNDNGDYVLLCYTCSKKYFAGANEVKYETKREDYSSQQISGSRAYPSHYQNSNGVSVVIPPFKTDTNAYKNVVFQAISIASKGTVDSTNQNK